MSSPNKSFRARMGTVMRRTSSVISFTRPLTPPIRHKTPTPPSSKPPSMVESTTHIDTSSATLDTPPLRAEHIVPSPIAESPAREAAASAEDLAEHAADIGPSPLSREVQPTSPDIVEEVRVPEPAPAQHAAVLDTSAGPGAFTDEPEEMSGYNVEMEEHTVPVMLEASPPAVQESSKEVEVSVEELRQIPPASSAKKETEDEQPRVEEVPIRKEDLTGEDVSIIPVAQVSPPPVEIHSSSYFEVPQAVITQVPEETRNPTFFAAVEENSLGAPAPLGSNQTVRPVETMPEPAATQPDYLRASEISAWRDDNDSEPTMGGGFSNGHAVYVDPFADPDPPVAPTISISYSQRSDNPTVEMPQPANESSRSFEETIPPSTHAAVMPSPHAEPSKLLTPVPSNPSMRPTFHQDYDETRPLLSRPRTPVGPYLINNDSSTHINMPSEGIPFPAGSIAPSEISDPSSKLHYLGWIEYPLPDGAVYYVHPTLHVTTDIDLRNLKKLESVKNYFERQKEVILSSNFRSEELWLREGVHRRGRKESFIAVKAWVDHGKRIVRTDRNVQWSGDANGVRKGKAPEEDNIDMEYRYWCYMESHPSHAPLPSTARSEALDFLTWAWTDRILSYQRSLPSPFSKEECSELMAVLRSFNVNESGLQAIIHTRIVSRVLMRIVQWRQMNFRPNKALPENTHSDPRLIHSKQRPFRRAIVDFVVSCICLGLPYMFFNRTQHRIDEEGGLRNVAPMVMIGASTCLMAAIVLSTSVTFLSLPGLDNLSRVAGFVAILFASFSMASVIIAVFRYKADMDRASFIGGEGLMVLSKRHVVLALPAIFLAYAIVAFVVGITLYSFRGTTATNQDWVEHYFEEYTKWTVLGVMGGLIGIIFTSVIILRR